MLEPVGMHLSLRRITTSRHAFHKDGLVILLILRQLREEGAGMQTQRGLPQHLVGLATPGQKRIDEPAPAGHDNESPDPIDPFGLGQIGTQIDL